MNLEIKDINKKYDDNLIIDKLNYQFNDQIYILKGENGVGKTTLLNIISFNDQNFSGQVIVNGQIVKNKEQLNNKVDYVTQNYQLLEFLSFSDNLSFFVQQIDNEYLFELIRKLDVEDLYNSNKMINQASGGEKQKIQIIIGLLRVSDILLLDEIDNHLDKKSLKNLVEILINCQKKLIISSHNIDQFFLENTYSEIQIVDKQIKLIKASTTKLLETEINDNSQAEISLKINKVKNKKLTKNNIYNQLLISFIIVCSIVFLVFILGLISFSFSYFKRPESYLKFSDTASVIYAPISSEFIVPLGSPEWLKTTPFLFTDDNMQTIKNIEYVNKVKPIPENTGMTSSMIFAINDQEYMLDESNPLNISYADLNYQLDSSIEPQNIFAQYDEIENLIIPKDISSNIPIDLYTSIDQIIYGQLPDDNSNQIIVDQYLGLYLIEQYNLNTLEDLIGMSIEYQVIDQSDQLVELQFEISGIYQSDYYNSQFIYAGYNEHSPVLNHNNTWMMDNDEITRSVVNRAKEYGNYNIDENDIPESEYYYDGFYIEVDTPEDIEKLTVAINEYDPYIQVDNNYVRANSNNYIYIKASFYKKMFVGFLSLVITMLIIYILNKLQLTDLQKNSKTLSFYGYSNQEINKYYKYSFWKNFKFIIALSILLNIILFSLIIINQLEYKLTFFSIILFVTIIELSFYYLINLKKRKGY